MQPEYIEILLHELADLSGKAAMAHFRARPGVTDKAGKSQRFDPVTAADREAEAAIRAHLAAHRPEDAILGEEMDDIEGTSGYRWVVDPIDGTRAFISGLPVWGTIIGLEKDGEPVAGLFHQPFTTERFWAVGGKAWMRVGTQLPEPIATSDIGQLPAATLMTTSPRIFESGEQDAYDRMEAAVQLARYGCDGYAYCMLASGQIELVVESGLKAFDVCGLVPIVQAAGGVMTSWTGGPAHQGGRILASANETLHKAAMPVLNA
ncbi:MAG: histidinol-phosphatase [Tepidamorphaceae bacterium]|nr:histidinol-phosphatase [Rhodobiaceae bacterium]MCC0048237.1 histidinol-phosphatase [Rhodobiaceae bacterium]